MELSKNARMKLFQQTTGWSTDKMRANKKVVNDIVGDGNGGGDTPTPSDITLESLIIDFDELGDFQGEASWVSQQGVAWNEVILKNYTKRIIPTDILYDLAVYGPAHEIYGIDVDGQTYYDGSDEGEGTFNTHTWYLLTSTEGEYGMPECDYQIDLGEYGLLFKTGAPSE